MPTANQIGIGPFETNLILNLLDKPDKTALVYDLSNGYNNIDMLMELSGITPRQVVGLDGKHQKPIMGRSNVFCPIAANAQAGANLVITLTDPNFQTFRIGDVVYDSNPAMTQARVIAKAPGSITVMPLDTALVAANHFVAGNTVVSGWNASINRGSTSVEPLYEYPKYIYNLTGIVRETSDMFRRDKMSTWVTWSNGFWVTGQDMLAMKRFLRERGRRDLVGIRGQYQDPVTGGTINQPGGLKWAIQDPANEGRGGTYRPLTNVMSQADLINFVTDIADNQAGSDVELTCLVGRQALGRINQLADLKDAVIFSGKQNTFGGAEVKGFDIRQFQIAGVKCNFVYDSLINDAEVFPATSTIPGVRGTIMQNSIWALDLSNYNTPDGKTVPAMERLYFGEREIEYGTIYGIGMGGSAASGEGRGQTISTSRDSIQFEMYSDCALDVVATKMGLMEYVI